MAQDSLPDGDQDQVRRVAIVLVGEEEAFIDLFQQFPPRRYPLVFAQDVSQALELCQAQPPQLLVLPLDVAPDATVLLELLRCARARQTRVVALSDRPPADEVAKLLTRTVSKGDTPALLSAVGELLGERRALPRVAMEVELTVSGLGKVMATAISGRSLFVPREGPLKSGQMVQVSLATSHGELRCWASVVRLGAAEAQSSGFVLALSDKERDARAYLAGLVRGMLLLERAEAAGVDPTAELPEGLTNRLAERLAQDVSALRARLEAQVALTDALNTRLDTLVEADSKAVKWTDVRPVLAQKWSAQRDLIKRLVAKVEGISAGQEASKRLRNTLHEEDELRQRLEQQTATVEALRGRVDELADSASQGDLLEQVSRAQGEIEKTLAGQARLLDELSTRIELVAVRTSPASNPEQTRRTLEDHSVQIASLSLRLDEIRDQVRLGQLDRRQLDELRAELVQQQQGLQALEQPVSDFEDQAPTAARVQDFESDVPTRQQPRNYPEQLFGTAAPGAPDSIHPTVEEPIIARQDAPEQVDDEPTEVTGGPAPQNEGPRLIFPDVPSVELTPAAVDLTPSLPAAASPRGTPLAPFRKPPRLRYPWWFYATVAISGIVVGVGLFAVVRLASPSVDEFDRAYEDAVGELRAERAVVGSESAESPDARVGLAPLDAGRAAVVDPANNGSARDASTPAELAADGLVAARPAPDASSTSDRSSDDASAAMRSTDALQPDAAVAGTDTGTRAAAAKDSATPRPPTRDQLHRRYTKRALELIRAGKYKASRRHLTRALKLRDDHLVRWLLARSHGKAGEHWAAVHHMKKSLAMAPLRLRAKRHDALGQLYIALGKEAAACEQFSAALTVAPGHGRARRNRARHCR